MEITAEQIAKHYSAATGFSVNYINEINAGEHDERMTAEEKADALSRNKAHLEIMLAKDFWTTEDLQPFRDAIA
jgi:hypothetical protein